MMMMSDLSLSPDLLESTPKQPDTTPRTPKSILRSKPVISGSKKKNLRLDSKSPPQRKPIPETLEYMAIDSNSPSKMKFHDANEMNIFPEIEMDLEASRSFDQDEYEVRSIWIRDLNLHNIEKKTTTNNYERTVVDFRYHRSCLYISWKPVYCCKWFITDRKGP